MRHADGLPGRERVRSEVAADMTEGGEERRVGFSRHVGDWRRPVADAAVDIVDICVPSHLHKEIALAAIEAGKHVYCEKPVGLSGIEASQIAEAAKAAGIKSLVGYSYLRNPMIGLARKLIDEGAIGRVLHFRGAHNEDYMADREAPFAWRCEAAIAGKAGALGDLGSHIISIARHLVGEIGRVCGATSIVVKERPVAVGSRSRRSVENDDQAQVLIEFRNGASGHIESSRVATGSHMDIAYEIVGSEGAIQFDGERMNELRYFSGRDGGDRRGFRTIAAGPEHPPYGNFVPGAAHGLGFNDQKTIETWELMELIAAGRPAGPDLAEAARIGRVLDAVLLSAAERRWVELD
jgi:predicted dehydrogenase